MSDEVFDGEVDRLVRRVMRIEARLKRMEQDVVILTPEEREFFRTDLRNQIAEETVNQLRARREAPTTRRWDLWLWRLTSLIAVLTAVIAVILSRR